VDEAGTLGAPRWRGERGRLEVWYLTFTDPASGWAGWIHGETVAPTGAAEPYAHGWTALFPPHRPPVVERFGPDPVATGERSPWFSTDAVEIDDGRWAGATSTLSWDLAVADDGPPLFTFPKLVWRRQLLPGAQVVPCPTARVTGSITAAGATVPVAATGASARIYGHGNAQRWGWLHAPLGDGGVLEIVTATARRRALRGLRPLAMVQLRLPGEEDWPPNPALACRRFTTMLRADGFRVAGKVRGRRLAVDVTLRSHQTVNLTYTDPDGATATCTNSELASAVVEVDGRDQHLRWDLEHTAHAEIGSRP
jgi:hypothetical protein